MIHFENNAPILTDSKVMDEVEVIALRKTLSGLLLLRSFKSEVYVLVHITSPQTITLTQHLPS